MPNFNQALKILSSEQHLPLLTRLTRGIEKESLRVKADGTLAQTSHPIGLGSTLTHPQVTTDYSEALVEMITPPSTELTENLQTLADIHHEVYRQMGDELLWVNSMPCVLGTDQDIPIARYGSSNVAKMKEAYRVGLGNRYGRAMQTIAGIHYNWSAPEECLSLLQVADGNTDSFQEYKTQAYFGLIRNVRRHTWLLLYLFGAAPAICRSFIKNKPHQLTPLDAEGHTLYSPYGTSLRMGDLGYQSKAQDSLFVCYNNLDNYIHTLQQALATPYPDYETLGVKDDHGEYLQLNTHLLQIENEFYSTIRPKRVAKSGETPLKALRERGIEYVEIRCIDLNPFEATGVNEQLAHFLDIFLLHALLSDSPLITPESNKELLANQLDSVYRGRDPELRLQRQGQGLSVAAWGKELLTAMAPVAELLNKAHNNQAYTDCLAQMERLLDHPEETPSARIISELQQQNISYFQWAMAKSRAHKESLLNHVLPEGEQQRLEAMAAQSLIDQQQIEAADQISFEEYLDDYFQQHHLA